MRCPHCSADDDKVIDSRGAEDGSAIRRRRECLACGRRFTTFERVEEVPLVVVKRSGAIVPFDRARIVAGIRAAAKNRPISEDQMEALAFEVEEQSRLVSGEVDTESIGLAVLEGLRRLDQVAYVRFASVYKGFDDADDFLAEVRALTKESEPKAPRRVGE
ncbi:MAG TPA: transcriptional regulator NrdR [Acidimicrobiales bacterium]|nr:transcriptional regulator NrdR [Acidimicrobiales bacterium]